MLIKHWLASSDLFCIVMCPDLQIARVSCARNKILLWGFCCIGGGAQWCPMVPSGARQLAQKLRWICAKAGDTNVCLSNCRAFSEQLCKSLSATATASANEQLSLRATTCDCGDQLSPFCCEQYPVTGFQCELWMSNLSRVQKTDVFIIVLCVLWGTILFV